MKDNECEWQWIGYAKFLWFLVPTTVKSLKIYSLLKSIPFFYVTAYPEKLLTDFKCHCLHIVTIIQPNKKNENKLVLSAVIKEYQPIHNPTKETQTKWFWNLCFLSFPTLMPYSVFFLVISCLTVCWLFNFWYV